MCFFSQWYPLVFPYIYGVSFVSQTMSFWMILLVTLNRYAAVCMPYKNHWRSLRNAKKCVIVLFILSSVLHIPSFFIHSYPNLDCIDSNGILLYGIRYANGYFIEDFMLLYRIVSMSIFDGFGPLAVILILNGRIILTLQIIKRFSKKKEVKS